MQTRTLLLVALSLLGLMGCSASPATPTLRPTPLQTASATAGMTLLPSASPGGAKSPVELKYIVLTQLGRPDWCDPDFYPLARDDEAKLALQHLLEMKADAALFAAIAAHLGIDTGNELSQDARLAIYRDWKVLTKAILLTPSGDGYAFDYIATRGPAAQQNAFHVAGTIDRTGNLDVTANEPSQGPACPICLARGTSIDTPADRAPVESLRPGMTVWSVNASGRRVAATLLRVGSTSVPLTHRVVHLELADGRLVDVSPGHPLPDGRRIGDLRKGDAVDGSSVLGTTLIAYRGGATFDLLPDTPSGAYWANGILLGSTLRP